MGSRFDYGAVVRTLLLGVLCAQLGCVAPVEEPPAEGEDATSLPETEPGTQDTGPELPPPVPEDIEEDTGPPPECAAHVDCDDANGCTTDICAIDATCVHVANAGDCDDGDLCTTDDHCAAAACVGEAVACDDDNPCTEDLCDANGECSFEDADGPCDDSNACTTADYCSNGQCLSAGLVDCDDGNPCTVEGCDLETGLCSSETLVDGSFCSDGDHCTPGDSCLSGQCIAGVVLDCDDGNPCTEDACDPVTGFCTEEYNTLPCDDEDVCTGDDACLQGECVGGDGTDCDDGNPCTDDPCDPVEGVCDHVFNSQPCDDGDACTAGDVCTGGACKSGVLPPCDDGTTCTSDFCEPETGECAHSPVPGGCEDGDLCTLGDQCADGACLAGTDKTCDDGNPCTDDGCLPESGACDYVANDANPCDDFDPCKIDDLCQEGVCSGVPMDCEDGDPCTVGESCFIGVCQPGVPKDCDDKNECTADDCDPSFDGGCVHDDETDGVPCSLPSACDVGACLAGACAFEAGADCDDGNPCTIDTCSGISGCWYEQEDCGSTTVECLSGVCDPAVGGCAYETDDAKCDDTLGCSLDACLPGEGCSTQYPEGCCEERPLMEAFEGQIPPGWQLSSSSSTVGWQIVGGELSTSGAGSLYYGNPSVWTYATAGSSNSGTIQTTPFTVPKSPSVTLQFRIWLHTESGTSFDKVILTTQPGNQQLWQKGSETQQAWTLIQVSLAAYKGQSLSLRFEFNTQDTLFNDTKGVFIDDLRVVGCN